MQNLIICGGAGTRLWPISTPENPKQFLQIFQKKSLFQLTLERNSHFCERFLVILGQKQRNIAKKQANAALNTNFMLEPVGRNTAPAIGLACFSVNPEEIFLVSPADHLIKADESYKLALQKAETLAKKGNLVTFGISPTYAETGYGYIEAKGEAVLSFCEKPELAVAQSYLEAGNYLWNSGMFCFKAGVYLQELSRHAPEIFQACKAAYQNSSEGLVRMEDMLQIPKESIDYAVMEKSDKVKVVPFAGGWSDLGSFDSLFGVVNSDESVSIDSSNNLVIAEGKTVALLGVRDSIVVADGDNILVCHKGESQKVKDVCEMLAKKKKKREAGSL